MKKKTRVINYVSKGSETTARLNLMLIMCGFKSESTITALHDYLVKGVSMSSCGVSVSNLERDVKKVNRVAAFVVAIEEYDWDKPRKSAVDIEADKLKMQESLNNQDVTIEEQ